ncbi:hypothetical protein VP01_1216g2 [Puccinia sorghi]|uniref:phosphoribosylaminoimidazole carboxylase n=1 Tax=Puccinia sorghi TaxID=27349 RepID=A0A0L6VQ84_9BASI|nr:hypothetical protein VP01_1216g2 [Puccinia sorghi]
MSLRSSKTTFPLSSNIEEQVQQVVGRLGFPLMLKSFLFSYDGWGNFLPDLSELKLYAKHFFPFACEIAVMVVKGVPVPGSSDPNICVLPSLASWGALSIHICAGCGPMIHYHFWSWRYLQTLDGIDTLHSIIQMSRGIPVATVAIGNSTNAALLAIRILSPGIPRLLDAMTAYMAQMESEVLGKVDKLSCAGWDSYL